MEYPLASRVLVVLGLGMFCPSLSTGQQNVSPPASSPAQRVAAETGETASAPSGPALRRAATQAAGSLVNRRTYFLYPSKFSEALSLAREMQAATRQELGHDMRILTARYGPFGTIILEFDFANAAEQDKFWGAFYPLATQRGWITKWFSFVQNGTNELWQIQ